MIVFHLSGEKILESSKELFNVYECHSLIVFIHKIVPADFSYEIVIVVLQIPKLGWNKNCLCSCLKHILMGLSSGNSLNDWVRA